MSKKNYEPGDDIEISESQYYRARRALCGMSACGCGDTRGDPNYMLCSARDNNGLGLEYYVDTSLELAHQVMAEVAAETANTTH